MDIIRTTGKEKKWGNPALNAQSIRTGSGVCVCFIVYFLVMQALGLGGHTGLRAFNFLFLLGGIGLALSRYAKTKGGKIEYFDGIQLGMQITLFAVIPFALFMGIYLNVDKALMNIITQDIETGRYLPSPMTAAVALGVEGISSGFITTFVLMPYFKKQ